MSSDTGHAALSARIDQVKAELDDVRQQLAAIEALVCQCQPTRSQNSDGSPITYLHAADCIVTAVQQHHAHHSAT